MSSDNFDWSGDYVRTIRHISCFACWDSNGIVEQFATIKTIGAEISDWIRALIRHDAFVADSIYHDAFT